ncbi:hypothetical protein N7523_005781 [Penicillium sp. IBT 18751x]|nr:hypothetical protein N7523_005628 [Penicillium sp. IBT 18751x]KAJ6118030.1 hypothetical protein N7523_005781 [Penicillium sp. IBT 18751x]
MAQIATQNQGAREVPSSPSPTRRVVGEDNVKGTQNCKIEPSATSSPRQAMPTQKSSRAKSDWEHRKRYFNSQSLEIDTLMDMIGLESVKEKFLAIKSKVDLSVRQNVDLSRQRFGSVLLENPGTGKTTVARLYAKFLAAAGVIPGHILIEKTGSELANEGVSGWLVEYTLNRVFLGNPGTGKTTIAKIYGQILVDIGLLSSAEVVVKNPSDFMDSVIGGSEKNTKGILAATRGKVLVVDEAYGLFPGGTSDGTGAKSDQYRSAFLDTNVAEVQSTPGEDRCVLLLGYKDQMQQMFQNVNPGLSRRFPMDQAFVFEDFTKQELDLILDLQLKEQGYSVIGRARHVVSDMLKRARNRPQFGNAGEIEILLNAAKMRHQTRLSSGGSTSRASDAILDAADFDENFDRADKDEASVSRLFKEAVGCESVISRLEGYQQLVRSLRQLNMDPMGRLPFNFVFRGPPGTGKTRTARKMGQIYYDMGLLASNVVVEVSATDLVGQFIGHTGPKTQKLLESALGKVLFIDEAYRLAEGHFAKDAMDELVDCITKPKFAQKLIIILGQQPAHSIQFEPLSSRDCIQLLEVPLSKEKSDALEKAQVEFDITCLQRPDSQLTMEMSQRFGVLSQTARWANARDVGTVKQAIFRTALKSLKSSSGKKLLLTKQIVIEELDNMIKERFKRENYCKQCPTTETQPAEPELSLHSRPADQRMTKVENKTLSDAGVTADVKPDMTIEPETQQQAAASDRDPDVTEEVWDQLRKDKAAADARETENLRLMQEVKEQKATILRLKEQEQNAAREAEKAEEVDEALRRHHEHARLLHELERRRHEEIEKKLEKQREDLAEARRKEQANQQKLRTMGVCPVGYRWIKQSAGYRCAGGSHYVSDAQLQ